MKYVGGVASIPRSNFTRTRCAATWHAFPGGFPSLSLSFSPFWTSEIVLRIILRNRKIDVGTRSSLSRPCEFRATLDEKGDRWFVPLVKSRSDTIESEWNSLATEWSERRRIVYFSFLFWHVRIRCRMMNRSRLFNLFLWAGKGDELISQRFVSFTVKYGVRLIE